MTKFRRKQDALFSQVGADFVALNVESGQCYGMETTSAAIWNLLSEPKTVAELCCSLSSTYAVSDKECFEDVSRFIDQLEREGLVQRSES